MGSTPVLRYCSNPELISAMLRRKSTADAGPTPQVRHLSSHLTSLDVIRDCCARGGRFTLLAEAPEGTSYTVLIDRGGPFNVSGAGLSGSEALVAAARLTSGTCSITEGWPVAQPLYQIGLDATLRMLSGDTMPTTVGELPAPRGVDTLRNASPAPPASIPQLEPATPAPLELQETDALTLSGPTTSADQGRKKHLVTQAILWLVQVDEPERYTFVQAQTLLKRALYYSLRGLFHPFRDRAAAQWQQAKQDWEKSAEVVAKQKARKARRSREVDVDPAPLTGR
jgi:hypothetical protein